MITYETIKQDGILLNANESPYPFSNTILEEIRQQIPSVAYERYLQDDACELREAYAFYLHIHPDQLIAGNGSDEMIGLIIGLAISPNKTVYTLKPDFSMYDYYTGMHGGRMITYSYDLNQPFHVEDFIQKGQKEQVNMILFSNPNNPTGRIINSADIKTILQAFPNIPVIIDEAYGEFADQSMLEYIDTFPNLLILRTMSKAFGMAALRLGFLIGCASTIARIRPYKVPYNVNSLTQMIGKIVLHHQEEMKDNITNIIKERERMYKQIQSMSLTNVQFFSSHANYLYGTSNNKQTFLQALKEKRIIIRDYADSDAFRITIGTQKDNTQVLSIIQSVFEKEGSICAPQR